MYIYIHIYIYIYKDSSPLTRLYEAACPKVGAPLTEAVVLTRVMDNNTFNPEVIQELLLKLVFYENNSVQKVGIVRGIYMYIYVYVYICIYIYIDKL
jgi:hypothetical protein